MALRIQSIVVIVVRQFDSCGYWMFEPSENSRIGFFFFERSPFVCSSSNIHLRVYMLIALQHTAIIRSWTMVCARAGADVLVSIRFSRMQVNTYVRTYATPPRWHQLLAKLQMCRVFFQIESSGRKLAVCKYSLVSRGDRDLPR